MNITEIETTIEAEETFQILQGHETGQIVEINLIGITETEIMIENPVKRILEKGKKKIMHILYKLIIIMLTN